MIMKLMTKHTIKSLKHIFLLEFADPDWTTLFVGPTVGVISVWATIVVLACASIGIKPYGYAIVAAGYMLCMIDVIQRKFLKHDREKELEESQ